MKLLMTTEKLDKNDSIFAFSHLWIKTIAEQVEYLTVIALSVGEYDLPKNVRVHSLGKENNRARSDLALLRKLKYLFYFYKIIWQERKNYDAVFVHMNQQNVILGAPVWKLLGKKIGLWYTHKAVTKTLILAVKMADAIFTAAEESMNVITNKKHVMGHGIDTKSFVNANRKPVFNVGKISITSIGRITPIKNLEYLIRATKILADKGYKVETRLIGPEVNEVDRVYKKSLDKLISDLNLNADKDKNNYQIIFTGGKKPEETKGELWSADVHVNLCPTGGLDKAVIEAACSGVHSLCANEAFRIHFAELADNYIFKFQDAENLAEKIENLIKLNTENKVKQDEILQTLQNKFVANFDVKTLIHKILEILKK